jgi:chitin disaccharide deacetylase
VGGGQAQGMKRLIVNADDFGLTAKVNQAIMDAHSGGLLSSTSLLANGEAFVSAVALSRGAPPLGVGVHLNLTDGKPVAPASSIPSLVNGQGAFARKPASLWRATIAGQVGTVEIEKEMRAQIEKVLAAGIVPTHLDGHKHVHALPALGKMSIVLARQYGIRAIRSVAERWSAFGYLLRSFPRAGTTILRQRLGSFALTALSRGWRSRLRQAGLAYADHFYGITPTGFLNADLLREILHHLPEGTSELMCHPGFVDEELKQTPTRLLAQREAEYHALSQPGIRLLAQELGIQLINYGDLANDFYSRASLQ